MSGNISITAEFGAIPQETLNVHVAGSGSGTVHSELPAVGIECGVRCLHEYNQGVLVELVAQPASATSVFVGWSGGGLSGTAPQCEVTLEADTEVICSLRSDAAFWLSDELRRSEQSLR